MSDIKFRPEVWSKALLDQMRYNLHYPGRRNEYSRQGHTEVTPYTEAEIQARQEAVDAWQKLTYELTTKGWLEDTFDGHFPSTETEHREWVYDETVEEHQARVAQLPALPDTVTVPVHKPTLNEDSINLIRDAI